MKKKKALTSPEKAAEQAKRAAAKEQMNEALECIALLRTEEQWYKLLLVLAEKRFSVNTFLTIHHKKIAFEEFSQNTPYSEIKTKPQVCLRTLGRYLLEFIDGFLTKSLTWTIMAIVSGEMFFYIIFFGA